MNASAHMTVNRKSRAARNRRKALGALISPLILLSATTPAMLGFYDWKTAFFWYGVAMSIPAILLVVLSAVLYAIDEDDKG